MTDADAITRALEGAAGEITKRREDLSSRLAAVVGRVAKLEALAMAFEGTVRNHSQAIANLTDTCDTTIDTIRLLQSTIKTTERPIAIDDTVEYGGLYWIVKGIDDDMLWLRDEQDRDRYSDVRIVCVVRVQS